MRASTAVASLVIVAAAAPAVALPVSYVYFILA